MTICALSFSFDFHCDESQKLDDMGEALSSLSGAGSSSENLQKKPQAVWLGVRGVAAQSWPKRNQSIAIRWPS